MRPPEFACTGYTARVQYQSKEISEIISSIITAHLLKFVFARMTKGPSKFRQAQHLSSRWEAQSGVPTRLSSKPLVGNSSNMASSRFGGAIAWKRTRMRKRSYSDYLCHPLMSGPTTRSNRPRVAAAEGPLRGRSKQGCWTCRFRRKKCDEQQAGTGLCGNCSRLRIDCLGWGERRPEWSKDPAQLKAFKDAMKAKIHHHMRSSSDPLLSIAEPSQPATIEAPSSAYPSSSANLSQETITAPFPSLALSSSLVRQLSSNSVDPYNYRAFVEHVRILVAGANLPRSCGVAFEEIARLGEWKHAELDQGRLSYRELAKRALRIEETLQAGLEQHTIPPVSAGTVP